MLISELSIVMPSLNEELSVPALVKNINDLIKNKEIQYEIIIIDDGSNIPLSSVIDNSENVKILRNQHTRGQSYSLIRGINEANFDYICTLDADGQNPPTEIIELLDSFNEDFDNIDFITGIRVDRKDKKIRTTYSRLANFIIRVLTGTACKDLGCSLKIFKKEMIKDINFNGDIHRILVPLFELRNYRMKQITVRHNKREFGETKYSFGRVVAVLIDTLLLYLTKGFTKSSRYSLGKLSLFFGTISLLLSGVSIYQKYFLGVFVHKNPLFLISIAMLFISLQLLVTSVTAFFIENKNNL